MLALIDSWNWLLSGMASGDSRHWRIGGYFELLRFKGPSGQLVQQSIT